MIRPPAAALAFALVGAPVAALAQAPTPASSQAGDPAAATIAQLNAALVQAGAAGGVEARFRRLQPAAEQAFDFATMTRVAVGPGWAAMPAADQQALVRAFGRFTAATFAKNFDGAFRFAIDPAVQTRAPDKVVTDTLTPRSGSPTVLRWRMRQAGGRWKVVDVFYNGAISQLATQRSDFASTLSAGGAGALVKKLDAKTEALLHG